MTIRKTRSVLLWLLALMAGFFLLFSVQISTAKAMSDDPTPTRQYVVDDYADVLSPNTKQMVINKEKQYRKTYARPQVVMMTIPDTESSDQSIDNYADSLLENQQWHFGNKKYNNGVLILLEDGKNGSSNHVRISTGYGVEDLLPDATCHQILEDNANLLKSSNQKEVDQGMDNVFHQVTKILDTRYAHLSKAQLEAMKRDHHRKMIAKYAIRAIIIILILAVLFWPHHHHNDYWNEKDHYFLWDCIFWHLMWGSSDSTPGFLNTPSGDSSSGGSFGGFSSSGGGGSFGGGGSSI